MTSTTNNTRLTPKQQAIKDMSECGVNPQFLLKNKEILTFIEQGRQY